MGAGLVHVRVVLAFAALVAAGVGDAAPPTTPPSGRVFACIELEALPAAEVYGALKRDARKDFAAEAQAQLAQIEGEHAALLSRLEAAKSLEARVLYGLQRVFNGIVVKTTGDALEELRAWPGVKAVHVLAPSRRLTVDSVPFVGGGAVWEGLGLDGAGVTVGIIDTGIDYTHAGLGGSGSAVDYEANDPTVLGDIAFPTGKVAGGYDFAGTQYDGDNPEADVPTPDPDPMDYRGHGTHVAGIAAGCGVTADGAAYTGPYDDGAALAELAMAPGVAPRATLYALKVFGDAGYETYVAAQAVEWATDPNGDGDFSDHLDVINLSIGLPFGAPAYVDLRAIDNAALAGVAVVAAAGNEGDAYFAANGPSAASGAISTAACADDGLASFAIRVTAPEAVAGLYAAGDAIFGPRLGDEPIVGDLVYADPPDGCALFANAEEAAGRIALVDRGGCHFCDKVENAAAAGALAVVVANDRPGDPYTMGGLCFDVAIPSVMIGMDDGAVLEQALAASAVTVSLAANHIIHYTELADTVAAFSSRGPARSGARVVLKPDLAAPGVLIESARAGMGWMAIEYSGTSMAAPHVAGAMALLRQLHPDWSVASLKALAMNTADHDVYLEENGVAPRIGPARAGAGRLDLAQAVASEVVAYGASSPEAVSVSFETLDVVGEAVETQVVRLENHGSAAADYVMSLDLLVNTPGAQFVLPAHGVITVPARGVHDVAVTLNADAARMKRRHDPSIDEVQHEEPRHWLSEESGYLVFEPAGGGRRLRVPLFAALRAASAMYAAPDTLVFDGKFTGGAAIALAGEGVHTGDDFPADVASLVTPCELTLVSPEERPAPGHLPDDWPSIADAADLKYVGVCSDYGVTTGLYGSTVYFAIVTHDVWGSPNEVLVHVYIDTNEDGHSDYRLRNWDLASVDGVAPSDVFVSYLENLRIAPLSAVAGYLNGACASERAIPVFMTNAMLLPVPVAMLGLTERHPAFQFYVETFSYPHESLDPIDPVDYPREPTDKTRWMRHEVLRPGFQFPGGPTLPDADGESIEVNYDFEAAWDHDALGILLVHHHNTFGTRGEVVKVPYLAPVIEASPAALSVGAAAGTAAVTIERGNATPLDWRAEVTAGGDWLAITSGRHGTDQGAVTLEYAANAAPDTRTATLCVFSDAAEDSPVCVSVTQEGVAIEVDTGCAAGISGGPPWRAGLRGDALALALSAVALGLAGAKRRARAR